MSFNPDTPLTGEEQTEDLLGRSQFCSRIADQICLPAGKPGLALSLEGPWGFGKTSAINLIACRLAKLPADKQPIMVHFNPWMVGSVEALIQEFFLQMSTAAGLSSHAEKAKKLSESLTAYSTLFSLAKWIPGAEPWTTLFAKSLKLAGEGANAVADLSNLNMAKQKRRVSDAIVDLGKPFVVFIDDLDRLPPQEIFAVIRLVKAVSDFPQVAYVIVFDPLYVEAALERSGISGGRAYLDKIIQIRVPLPRIGLSQIGKLVDQETASFEIEKALRTFAGDQDRLGRLYHGSVKFLLRTPRDVHRVFNRLRLLYPALKTEVGLADLLGIETIAITSPPLYDHLMNQPQAYVGPLEGEIVFKEPAEFIKGFEEERRKALDACPQALRKPLADLVCDLFPLTATGLLRGQACPPRNSGLVANAENLLIVLSGGLPPTEVSLADIRSFIENPEQRQGIASRYANREQLEDFLDLLHTSLGASAVSNPEGIVEILSEMSESDVIKELKKGRGFFKADVRMQIFWVLRVTLEAMPKDEAKQMITRILQPESTMALSVELLRFLRWQQGIPDEDKQPETSWLVTRSELETLTQKWVEETRIAFSSGGAWISNEAASAFFLLSSIDLQAIREIVAARLAMRSDEVFDELARTIGSGSNDSLKGEYANFSESILEELGDVEVLKQMAAKRLTKDDLYDSDLRAIYSSMVSGTKEYFCDHRESPERKVVEKREAR